MPNNTDTAQSRINPQGLALISCPLSTNKAVAKQLGICQASWLPSVAIEGANPEVTTLIAEFENINGQVIIPFKSWLLLTQKGRQSEATNFTNSGGSLIVCFFPDDDVIAQYMDVAALILNEKISLACYFPTFKDGRGYSTAALLRGRFGYLGTLLAMGDVLIDQVVYLTRVGFDELSLRADQPAAKALAALATFSVTAQDDWRSVRSQKKVTHE